MEKNRNPITVYYCGSETCAPGHYFGPAVRPHYLIHFVLSGKGTYRVNNKTYNISKGQAFLIKPKEVTYYCADYKDPWEYVWIAFDSEDIELFLKRFYWKGNQRVCDIVKTDNLRKYLFEMVDCSQYLHKVELEMMGYFYLIFGMIKRSEDTVEYSNDRSYLDSALHYIRHNYSYEIKVQDICKKVGIERSYLFKLFKKYLSQSPKEYLTEYRLLVAKELLKSTQLKTTEIAASCGFHDSSVFCKNFKRMEGLTPQEYRRVDKKKYL